jgi:phosphate transport system substrate-binding protein
MKKLSALILVFALVLTACNGNEPAGELPEPPPPEEIIEPDDIPEPEPEIIEPEEPEILEPNLNEIITYLEENFGNFRIDGSTSMIPLHQSLRNRFGDGEEIWHNRTVWAFEQFVNGGIDILLSVDFSDELLKMAEENGVNLVQLPVTREAFVFLINSNNPVQSLTQEQIKAIYNGEITNWSEVGGDDAPISAFQRNSDSGSQMRMVKFMGDTPLVDKDVTYYHGMGDIIVQIANFDSGKYSIAYNMYTFAEKQFENEDVVLLAVDGVSPTDETIFDNSYPLVIYNYIYYNANNEEAAEFAENLHAFLMSEDGQKLISDSGYVNLNINFDRNMRVSPNWRWFDNNEESLGFYNPETGEFYEPDGQGGLLVFDNYADYVLHGSEFINNAKVREFLELIWDSNISINQFTARIWDDAFYIYPIVSFVQEEWDAFTFRYEGRYFNWLRYYIEDDRLVLIPMEESSLDHYAEIHAEAYTDYIKYVEPGLSVELTFEDLKNLYVLDFTSNWYYLSRNERTLEYFKPFN